MALSNNVIGAINFIAMLLSIPVIGAGIWLATEQDNSCVKILQWPVIILGVLILVVALAGFIGGFWRISWLLIFYLIGMLVLIVLLACLVVFIYMVTVKGSGHPVPSRAYLEYNLDDFSGWLRRRVRSSYKWERIRSCLSSSSMCAELNQSYRMAQDFFNAHISPLQSGCCKPPTECGYTFVNPTYWISPINTAADMDCLQWSNDQTRFRFVAMGSCFSARVKADCSFRTGPNSPYVSSDGNDMIFDSGKTSSSVPPTPRTEGEILRSPNLKSFSFSDLKMATRNFRPDTVLGGGGFGSVFKGWIDENSFAATKPGTGLTIAVKKLHQESYQGHREWLAELNYLGQFSHPNLVRLIGYCLEDDRRLLVYEFMPRGCLENHLFRRGSYFQALSWSLRLKVALGAAKGLAFLHSAKAKVIYRDFKTSNILLDSNYNAKLSDFGLAKDVPTGDKSHVSTRVMGTYGYAAPEYLATGHLTTKSDVYSYGVVLLEMLSGRRAIDKNRPNGEHKLIEWSKPYLANKHKVFKIMDNRLQGQYTIDVAQKVANIALRCTSLDPRLRPKMVDVVKELEQLQDTTSVDNSLGKTCNGSRQRSQSTGDAGRKIANAAYPRPSAPLIHSK